jgi:methylenetetrahydrofolate dehydrogenase (NADP+)/methenyltetrahydrofolate cyclohydrolase
MKQKKAEELGIDFELKTFAADALFEDVEEEIKLLCKDKTVTGVMVQLPLPKKFLGEREPSELLLSISPKKDVDGLTGKGKVLPAVVRAVLSIIDDEKIEVKGQIVTIIGASPLIGLPLAKELKKRKANVTVCDVNTKNLREETLRSDILISATGIAGMIYSKMIKEGVVMIDVGIAKVDGKVSGDADFESVEPLASKITPVPGGVGPVTVISLMENIVEIS